MRRSCLKRQTRCVITREDGTSYEATNSCFVVGDECPRVAADSKSGEDYQSCKSEHAEASCAKLAEETKHMPGKATIYGHTWICKDCQEKLLAVNVNVFEISR